RCARRLYPSQRSLQAGKHGLGALFDLLLALGDLDQLEHTFDREDAVDRHARAAHRLPHTLRCCQHLLQQVRVQPDLRSSAFLALNRQRDGNVAASQPFRRRLANAWFKRFMTWRELRAQVEPAAIDTAHLPVPARMASRAVRACEAGHALERHRVPQAAGASWLRVNRQLMRGDTNRLATRRQANTGPRPVWFWSYLTAW